LFSIQACGKARARVLWMLFTIGTATPSMTGKPWWLVGSSSHTLGVWPGAAGVLFQLGDQPHQVVPGQQAGADQQHRRRAVEQRSAQCWQGALHQALQVDPVAAAAVGGVGLKHDVPVDAGRLGLVAQGGQQQRVEVDPLQRSGLHAGVPKRCSSSASAWRAMRGCTVSTSRPPCCRPRTSRSSTAAAWTTSLSPVAAGP
jgi:hypothetical protein